eukprot:116193-Lingulodinium_polyedra.AAC.1
MRPLSGEAKKLPISKRAMKASLAWNAAKPNKNLMVAYVASLTEADKPNLREPLVMQSES